VRRAVRRAGGEEVRQRGSHLVVRAGGCTTVIPLHTGDIPEGTLRAIEKDPAPTLGEGWLKR
jgi:predicted RNA binding protein YcfA (HicA-like mRNA interferase family)